MGKEEEKVLRNLFQAMKSWGSKEVIDWINDVLGQDESMRPTIKEISTNKILSGIELANSMEKIFSQELFHKSHENFEDEQVRSGEAGEYSEISSSESNRSEGAVTLPKRINSDEPDLMKNYQVNLRDKYEEEERQMELIRGSGGTTDNLKKSEIILKARRMRFGSVSPVPRPVKSSNGNERGRKRSRLLSYKNRLLNSPRNVRLNSVKIPPSNPSKNSPPNLAEDSRSISRAKSLERTRSSSRQRSRSNYRQRPSFNSRHRSRSVSRRTGVITESVAIRKLQEEIFKQRSVLAKLGKWTDELQARWVRWKSEERKLKTYFRRKQLLFGKRPSLHPKYKTERSAFFEKLAAKKLEPTPNQGNDPEYTTKWEICWEKRIYDLLQFDMGQEMEKLQRKHGMDLATLKSKYASPNKNAPMSKKASAPSKSDDLRTHYS